MFGILVTVFVISYTGHIIPYYDKVESALPSLESMARPLSLFL